MTSCTSKGLNQNSSYSLSIRESSLWPFWKFSFLICSVFFYLSEHAHLESLLFVCSHGSPFSLHFCYHLFCRVSNLQLILPHRLHIRFYKDLQVWIEVINFITGNFFLRSNDILSTIMYTLLGLVLAAEFSNLFITEMYLYFLQ